MSRHRSNHEFSMVRFSDASMALWILIGSTSSRCSFSLVAASLPYLCISPENTLLVSSLAAAEVTKLTALEVKHVVVWLAARECFEGG